MCNFSAVCCPARCWGMVSSLALSVSVDAYRYVYVNGAGGTFVIIDDRWR